MKGRITYQAIAEHAKVSVSTVSRVANGSTHVGQKIQERVRQAASMLGSDLYGRQSKKSKVLAYILSNRRMLHPFHSHILVGAEAASSGYGYNMLFTCFFYHASKSAGELHLPTILESPGEIAGFILAGTNSANLLNLLAQRGVPFVVLGNNVLGEWQPDRYDVVWFDDIQGAWETTQFLQSLGHREIWFVGNRRLTWYARRYQGYRRAMEEAGLPVRLSEFDSAEDLQLGYLGAKSILGRKEPVTAIFAAGDLAAQGVCSALAERGLNVPGDISVAGFDDIEAAKWYPPLTSTRVFHEQISKRVVDLLVNRLRHPGIPPQQSVIPTQLIKRESCGHCPPTQGLVVSEPPLV